MALNMKTYKGFNKNPYCEAHIPKAKATTIAETPELKRIAENTKIQSNAKYHAEFEKSKGKLTQIADDPETLRIKQNTMNISNVAYHGEIQKKAAMERQRELTEIVDNRDNNESEYFSETLAAESLPHYQPPTEKSANTISPTNNSPYSSVDATNNYANNNNSQHSYSSTSSSSPPMSSTGGNMPTQQNMINNNPKYQQPPNYNGNGNINSPQRSNNGGMPVTVTNQQMQQQLQQKYYDQYENQSRMNGSNGMSQSQSTYNSKPYGQVPQQQMTASYNQQMNYYNHHQNGGSNGASGTGKITDYDPMTGRQNQTLIYSSDRAAMQVQQQQQQRRVGSVNDMDPVNGYYGSIAQEQQNYIQQQQQQQRQFLEQQRLATAQQQQQLHQQQQQQQAKSVSKVRVYRALYDYEAQDYDEVSFSEGDLIFEVNSIDGGWMTGRIERTGKIGMLPANYIEQVMI
ncbi:hypothetical protein PVAND_008470 [Polypedilum vanderplanki]|uniref:SH3 domain-containing protein n=1 Tax=Polypedilum vanderplanki TaxID=319348 RepID=A0A9J6C9M1_POLVA|nr:hypothetical protein PVAND_008470 [Polypedilum vanderplanki]